MSFTVRSRKTQKATSDRQAGWSAYKNLSWAALASSPLSSSFPTLLLVILDNHKDFFDRGRRRSSQQQSSRTKTSRGLEPSFPVWRLPNSIHVLCKPNRWPIEQYPSDTPRPFLAQGYQYDNLVYCSRCRKCRVPDDFEQDPPGYFTSRSCVQCNSIEKKPEENGKSKEKKASKRKAPAEQASSSRAPNPYQQAFVHVQSSLGFMSNQEHFGLPPPPSPHSGPTTGPSQQTTGHAQSTPILPANIGFMSTQHSIGPSQAPTGYSEQSTCPPLKCFAGYG
ncbi:hypothetical protein CSAL01_09377 [Colletotrichum salicis]|uniref:Uncharacterized protein n=1 Tax=Colletotrichum salicis TaxID=1209931 RepID=A0A135SLH3_9PEZI|nr:hypothetical protein CSAL01_09377 [Colletotrichum salicis]